MLSASTVKKIMSAGSNTMCGARWSLMRPMAIMLPHVGVSVSTLAPRIASVPSATIATAMPSSAIDDIAGSTLGSTSRVMMRRCFAPWARAASTNSRSDHDSVLARVMRPSTGIDTKPEGEDQRDLGIEPAAALVPGLRAQDGDQRQRQDHRGDGEEHVEQQADDDVDLARGSSRRGARAARRRRTR